MTRMVDLYKKAEQERKEREEAERRQEEDRLARQRAAEREREERRRRDAEEGALYVKEKKEKWARLLERSGLQKILDELKNELGMEIVTFTSYEGLDPKGFAIGQVIHYDYEEPINEVSVGGDLNKGTTYIHSTRIGTAYYRATGIIGVRVEIWLPDEEITVWYYGGHQSFTPENNWKGLAEAVVKNSESGIAKRRVVHELHRRRKILGLF